MYYYIIFCHNANEKQKSKESTKQLLGYERKCREGKESQAIRCFWEATKKAIK